MKILHITSHLNIGGITSYILSLSKALVDRGHRVTVASGGGQLEAQLGELDAGHWRVPLQTKSELSPGIFLATAELSRRLRQEPVDVLHAHTRVGQVVAHRLSRRHRIPYVTTWHGFFQPSLGRRIWPCTGDMTIAISDSVRRQLLEDFHVPSERIRLIHNGVDVAYFAAVPDREAVQAYRAQWWVQDHRPVIGSVGRLASGGVKGFDILLKAVQLARRELPELEVLLVGDGPRRAFLEQEAERLGIREHVHLVGVTQDIRLPLAAMDVFVFTSRWQEGFGLALIEAMAAGKPIVAVKAGAVPEIIEHDQNGWLVPAEDAAALAQAIVRICKDRTLASRFAEQAQRRVREVFGLSRMVDAVEAVYQHVCAQER